MLYPRLSRATFSTGDDVAWAAEHDAERALRLSQRIRGDGGDGEAFDELTAELAELIRCDDEVVIPLLLDRLDAGRVSDLADALAEVEARTHEPDAPG